MRLRTAGAAIAVTTAALSLSMMYFGVAFGAQSPPQEQIFNQHFPAAAPVPNLLLG